MKQIQIQTSTELHEIIEQYDACYFAVEQPCDDNSVIYAYQNKSCIDVEEYPDPFRYKEAGKFIPRHITRRITSTASTGFPCSPAGIAWLPTSSGCNLRDTESTGRSHRWRNTGFQIVNLQSNAHIY